VLGLLAVAGCGVGSGDDGGGGSGSMTIPPDSMESAITCTAQLSVTGTFTASGAIDPTAGCQPQGTWQVTATVTSMGTCATVPLKPSYSYTLSGVGRATTISYANKPSAEDFHGNIESSGDGACSGFFEHIDPDGSNFDQLQLRPGLPKPVDTSTTIAITGTGEFNLWSKHP